MPYQTTTESPKSVRDSGYVKVRLLIWPSIILSIVGTVLLNLIFHLFR